MLSMAESSDFFNERFPRNAPEEYTELLQEPAWAQYCAAVLEIEEKLRNLGGEAAQQVIECEAKLDAALGESYLGHASQVLGIGYRVNKHGRLRDKIMTINTQSADFIGTRLLLVDNAWRAYLGFYVSEERDAMPYGMYYLPPNTQHIMTIGIKKEMFDPTDDETALEMIIQHALAARSHTTSRSFTKRSASEQRETLYNIIASADAEIPRELYQRDSMFECLRYYTAYDDSPELDLRLSLTDYSDRQSEEGQGITGYVIGYAYPELNSIDANKRLSREDFVFNDGAMCLAIRNDEARRTYYAVPQKMREIV